MALPQKAVPSMTETLDAYMEAFNAHDLDGVMTAFAEGALYRPGSGVERVGRAAIREEFEPQFNLAFGAMRFDEIDRVIDEKSRKIVIRYECRHDLAHARPTRLAHRVQAFLVGTLLGARFGWEGVDVFHFDEAGKIVHKYTYAGFTRPRLEKSLGAPLPLPPWWARKT